MISREKKPDSRLGEFTHRAESTWQASENLVGRQLIWLAGLIAPGVVARLVFADVPNFAPVCGLALFSGFVLSSRAMAVVVPVGILAVSDIFLGGYQPLLKLAVYVSLATPAFLGAWLRSTRPDGSSGRFSAMPGTISLAACVLGSSLFFFLVSNFATWLVTDWYPKTTGGLWLCFLRAVPFFKYTLAGDLVFSGLLFGTFAVCAAIPARSRGCHVSRLVGTSPPPPVAQ
jgi:hypothetical protein